MTLRIGETVPVVVIVFVTIISQTTAYELGWAYYLVPRMLQGVTANFYPVDYVGT